MFQESFNKYYFYKLVVIVITKGIFIIILFFQGCKFTRKDLGFDNLD